MILALTIYWMVYWKKQIKKLLVSCFQTFCIIISIADLGEIRSYIKISNKLAYIRDGFKTGSGLWTIKTNEFHCCANKKYMKYFYDLAVLNFSTSFIDSRLWYWSKYTQSSCHISISVVHKAFHTHYIFL